MTKHVLMLRFAITFAIAFASAFATAAASPREATLAGLSCAACHNANGTQTDIGRAWAVPVNRLEPIGSHPSFGVRATAVYSSDRDTSGLAKLVNDYLEATVAGKIAPNLTYAADQRFVDGGLPGATREAFVEYHRRRSRYLLGATDLPLPIDPDRYRDLHTDYVSIGSTVGDNPFSLARTHPAIGGFVGDALAGLEVGALALAGHESGSGVPQRSIDTLVSLSERGRGYVVSLLRYDGSRALASGNDRFSRDVLEGVAALGRLRLDLAYLRGFDSAPRADSRGRIGSSAGLIGLRYDLGDSCFAAGRYEGEANGLGSFERLGVVGAGCRIDRSMRLTLEDAIRHEASGTHHVFQAVGAFGASSAHGGVGAY